MNPIFDFIRTTIQYPISSVPQREDISELRKSTVTFMTQIESIEPFYLFNLYSRCNKLIRITSLIVRFIHNCRNKTNKKTGSTQVSELKIATQTLLKVSQSESFSPILKILSNKTKESLPRNIHFLSLIDEHYVLRVGRRLKNSDFNYHKKTSSYFVYSTPFHQIIIRSHACTTHACRSSITLINNT